MMNNSNHSISLDEELILGYLYQQLDQQQRANFEQRLKTDKDFKQLFLTHQALEKVLPKGIQPKTAPEQLNALEWNLKRRLKQTKQSVSLFARLRRIQWFKPYRWQTQFASLGFAFVCGFIVSNQVEQNSRQAVNTTAMIASEAPLNYLNNNDYEIVDLNVKHFDPASQKVNLDYSLVARTSVSGKLDDPSIQNLLAISMQNDVSDSTRLNLAELMQNYSNSQAIQQALSHSLLNDPNPGVRMAAADSLVALANQESVKQVLVEAFANDTNPGIRVAVFDALLANVKDKKTLEQLKQFASADSNAYIRNAGSKIFEGKRSNQNRSVY
ncbi:HEAT repeat domain-containing protein [Aliikangiella sp. IMCC44653]